jgi:hypothetical protein
LNVPEDLEHQTDDTPRPLAYCFIGEERVCGPDCMAYMSSPADVPLDPQQRQCLVLVSADRLARHAVIGVKIVGDMLTFVKQANADVKRTEQKPPAPPR